jgi:hypothetical protein
VFSQLRGFSRRPLGYVLVGMAGLLLCVAWFRSFPLSVESRTSYLYDSIDPSFWVGLAIGNVGLFLVASKSTSRWERFFCAFTFLILAYSIKYYFAFLEGPDEPMFRGLTENLATGQIPPIGQHDYYQWPVLMVLTRITSDVIAVGLPDVERILFFVWTFVFAAGLFTYSNQRDDLTNFLTVVAYTVSAYAYLNWQFAAWTFGSVLLLVCVNVMARTKASFRIVALIVFTALVFSHSFLPLFLVLAVSFMAIKERRYVAPALLFGSLFGVYLFFRATILFAGLPDYVTAIFFLGEYLPMAAETLTAPLSAIDSFAQIISRSVTLSMWTLLAFSTLSSFVLRRLRTLDISVGLSGLIYGIMGSVVKILGYRSLQIVLLPTLQALGCVAAVARTRKILLAYFLLVLAVFPLGMLHIFYNDSYYMTFRDQDAADFVITKMCQAGEGGFTMMVRSLVYGYLSSKPCAQARYAVEKDATQLVRLQFIFMSPELEKGWVARAGLAENQVLELEASAMRFSRIYSNGHVTILQNLDVRPT